MKNILVLILFIYSILFFNKKKEISQSNFQLAFVEEIYLDKSENKNKTGDKEIRKYVGVFPKGNDTITIFKLNNDVKEDPEKILFWITKSKEKESLKIHSSEFNEDIKIVFNGNNKISIDDDIYTVNNEYYNYLKKKALIEGSILELAFFLKDGYGDYAQSLELLTKNWRNQKQNSKHKIISAQIKNKNYQSDNLFFKYKIQYSYFTNNVLESVKGDVNFNKKYINENKKYLSYSIDKLINERAQVSETLYINKETLFDSIIGNREQYSTSKIFYYVKYQSKLKAVSVNTKPKDFQEIINLLGLRLPANFR